MKYFYLKGRGVCPISEYRLEYEGKILCEDPRCRQPIRYINTKYPHTRIDSRYKHKAWCSIEQFFVID